MLKTVIRLYALSGTTFGAYVFYENNRKISTQFLSKIEDNRTDYIRKELQKIILMKSIYYGVFYPYGLVTICDKNKKHITDPLYTSNFRYRSDKYLYEKSAYSSNLIKKVLDKSEYKYEVEGIFRVDGKEIINYFNRRK